MTKHNEGLSMVSGGRGIGGGRGVVRLLLWVDSGYLIGDIGDISIITIAGVLDVLDSAIGKSNRVGSGNVGGTIRLLLSVEVSLGVVISNSVGEGVGRDLIRVLLGLVGWSRSVVSWSSLHNNWSVDSMVDRGVDSVGNNWSVDSMGHMDWGMVNSVGHVDRSMMDSVVSVMSTIGSGGNNSEESTATKAFIF